MRLTLLALFLTATLAQGQNSSPADVEKQLIGTWTFDRAASTIDAMTEIDPVLERLDEISDDITAEVSRQGDKLQAKTDDGNTYQLKVYSDPEDGVLIKVTASPSDSGPDGGPPPAGPIILKPQFDAGELTLIFIKADNQPKLVFDRQ